MVCDLPRQEEGVDKPDVVLACMQLIRDERQRGRRDR
jgi:hypothetical protein